MDRQPTAQIRPAPTLLPAFAHRKSATTVAQWYGRVARSLSWTDRCGQARCGRPAAPPEAAEPAPKRGGLFREWREPLPPPGNRRSFSKTAQFGFEDNEFRRAHEIRSMRRSANHSLISTIVSFCYRMAIFSICDPNFVGRRTAAIAAFHACPARFIFCFIQQIHRLPDRFAVPLQALLI